MINTTLLLERFLQRYRFRVVKKYLRGDVLDFGGNNGELLPLVEGRYTLVNYDHAALDGLKVDTIVSLAVVEHLAVREVYEVFRKFSDILQQGGVVFVTTPTPAAKPILEILARVGLLDADNIAEHKHYWSKQELFMLASSSGFVVQKYRKFQLGLNQYVVFRHGRPVTLDMSGNPT